MPEKQVPDDVAAVLPPLEVDAMFDLAAAFCRRCGRDMTADEAEAKIKDQLRVAFSAGVAYARNHP